MEKGLKREINNIELFIGLDKRNGCFVISTIALKREQVWDKIYYHMEKASAQYKRELAKKELARNWEVVGFNGSFPYRAMFTP